MINRFALLVFLSVAVLAVALGFALSTFLTNTFTEWEGDSTASIVRPYIDIVGLDALFATPHDDAAQAGWSRALPKLLSTVPGVVRCRVWHRDGTVLWSDDATAIGQRAPSNPGFQAALKGHVVADLRSPSTTDRNGQFRTVLSVHIPIQSSDHQQILGVVEIHKDPARLLMSLRSGLIAVWSVSLLGGAIVYLIFRSQARPRDVWRTSEESARPTSEIRAEIERRLGFFPPFFEPAMPVPAVLENLWQQTISAYVDNPLPALFKEKLFAYLARYCAVPYCIVCHSCALRPLGMTATEVLTLLESPPPSEENVAAQIIVLVDQPAPLPAWPEGGSPLETTLMASAILIFLYPREAEQCRAEVRRLLGPVLYSHLSEFLCYVKTCFLWVELHPELAYEADWRVQEHLRPMLEQEPRLSDFFRTYGERVKREGRHREGVGEPLTSRTR